MAEPTSGPRAHIETADRNTPLLTIHRRLLRLGDGGCGTGRTDHLRARPGAAGEQEHKEHTENGKNALHEDLPDGHAIVATGSHPIARRQ